MSNGWHGYFIISFLATSFLYPAYFNNFVFITASYNNQDKYKDNLTSMLTQNYPAWAYRIIYIDDSSPDGTGKLVESYLNKIHMRERVLLIRNKVRRGELANIYDATHLCKDDEIIVILDGDDKLAHNGVLSYLNKMYHYHDVWMTYGQFKYVCKDPQHRKHYKKGVAAAFDESTIASRTYRKDPRYVLTHPRTYYAWLAKQIKLKDLLYQDYFYLSATDTAIMYPLIEMAGRRFKFIDEPLYLYTYNPKPNSLQLDLASVIRGLPPYPVVHQPIFSLSQPLGFSVVCSNEKQMRHADDLKKELKKELHICFVPQSSVRLHGCDYCIRYSDIKQLLKNITSHEDDVYLFTYDFFVKPHDLLEAVRYVKRSYADICFIKHGAPPQKHGRPLYNSIYSVSFDKMKSHMQYSSIIMSKKFLREHPSFLDYLFGKDVKQLPRARDILCLYYQIV